MSLEQFAEGRTHGQSAVTAAAVLFGAPPPRPASCRKRLGLALSLFEGGGLSQDFQGLGRAGAETGRVKWHFATAAHFPILSQAKRPPCGGRKLTLRRGHLRNWPEPCHLMSIKSPFPTGKPCLPGPGRQGFWIHLYRVCIQEVFTGSAPHARHFWGC